MEGPALDAPGEASLESDLDGEIPGLVTTPRVIASPFHVPFRGDGESALHRVTALAHDVLDREVVRSAGDGALMTWGPTRPTGDLADEAGIEGLLAGD